KKILPQGVPIWLKWRFLFITHLGRKLPNREERRARHNKSVLLSPRLLLQSKYFVTDILHLPAIPSYLLWLYFVIIPFLDRLYFLLLLVTKATVPVHFPPRIVALNTLVLF